jgi:hypothetical protein
MSSTRVGDIYDALKAKIVSVLPTHAALSNPYFPETTSDLALTKAYGIAMGEGTNLLGSEDSGALQSQRNFIVTLSLRKFATKGNISARETAEKNIMADFSCLKNSIASDRNLSQPALIQKIEYISDGGIEFLRSEQDRNDILLIRTVFAIDYEEVVCVQ